MGSYLYLFLTNRINDYDYDAYYFFMLPIFDFDTSSIIYIIHHINVLLIHMNYVMRSRVFNNNITVGLVFFSTQNQNYYGCTYVFLIVSL